LTRAIALWNSLKTRRVKDGPLRVESVELRISWAQKHVVAEQVVLGELVDYAKANLYRRLSAGKGIANVEVLAIEVVENA